MKDSKDLSSVNFETRIGLFITVLKDIKKEISKNSGYKFYKLFVFNSSKKCTFFWVFTQNQNRISNRFQSKKSYKKTKFGLI